MNKNKFVAMALVGTMLMTMAPTLPAMAQNVETASVVDATGADVAAATEALVPDTSWYSEEATQFTVNTANELAGVAKLVSDGNTFEGKTIFLGDNIDMAGYTGWTPIGDDTHVFAGTFDGKNHVISNLTLEGTGKYLALFGKGDDCIIQNLQMDGVTINAKTENTRVAAVAGFVDKASVIENVHVKNLKAKNASAVAGIVRSLGSGSQASAPGATLRQCSVDTASFSDCTYAHGMAYAVGKYAVMEDCHVSNVLIDRAQVSDKNTYGTGLFFMSSDGANIKGCSAEKVTVNNTTFGTGLLYQCGVNSTIEGCNIDSLTVNNAKFSAGAIYLLKKNSIVENCNVNNVAIDGAQYAVGFLMSFSEDGIQCKNCHVTQIDLQNIKTRGAGFAYNALKNVGIILENCSVNQVSIGMKNGENVAAGFFVSSSDETTEKDKAVQFISCRAEDVSIKNARYASGFISTSGTYTGFKDCAAVNVELINAGYPTVEATTKYIAVAAGFARHVNSGSQLENCHTKNVQILSPDKHFIYVGGMTGLVRPNVTMSDCRVDGITIQGKSGMQVGGFTGNVEGSSRTEPNTFTNCAVTGLDMQIQEAYPYRDDDHKSKVGGFIGTTGKIATFNNCSVEGKIQAADSAGGFVGDLGWVSLSDENATKYRSEFNNCTADVDVTAGEIAGGFVGIAVSTYTQKNGTPKPENSTATFSNCVAKGKTTSATGVAGGFAGTGDRGDYIACRAEGAVDGDVAGGFMGKALPNEFIDGTDTNVTFDNCTAAGTVLGGTQAGGFMGQAETETATSGESDTLITFNNTNTASPVVAGSKADTVVEKVAKVEDQDKTNVNGLPTEMPNTSLVTPKGDAPLTMDSFGHIVVPETGANKDDQALNPGDIVTNEGAIAQGGSIKDDGSISMGSGGSMIKPDGSVETFPNGGLIGSDGNISQNPSPSTPSRPSYTISVPSVSNGVVETSPARAKKGTKVTMTVTPDEGYVVDEIVVTDKNGEKIAVTDAGDGKYTFIMPASQVEVVVTFKKDVASGDWDNPFVDVPKDAWYKDAVHYVYENGLMVGVEADKFGPNVITDRGQLVTILWRMAGEPQATNGTDFSDVPSNAYYAKAVAWAAENGITAGFEDGTFRPQTGLSREQMAAFFMNYAEATGVDTSARADISEFTDVNPDSWSYNALSWAKAVGLLAGVSDTEMAPQATATRAQIAAVLQRYCENVAK